jgi:hypothetical protein
VLRGGRHVLVLPAAHAAGVLAEPGLRPYLDDLALVTADDAGTIVLVRPDGHVAARGKPGGTHAVTAYLRDLFSEPASAPVLMAAAVGRRR